MNIYVAFDLSIENKKRLKAIIKDSKVFYNIKSDKGKIPDKNFLKSEIVFGNVPASWITKSKKLKWIQLESSGFGEYLDLDFRQLKNKIKITNLKAFFSKPVAQTILSGILSFYRGIDRFIILKDKKKWIGDPLRKELDILSSKNILFFGYGSINKKLHHYLKTFNCNFDFINSKTNSLLTNKKIKVADIIICCSPETKGTIKFFDNKKFTLLKKDSLFINAGRGSLIDEKELIKKLKLNHIKGAILDVTQDEPLKIRDPLWTCPNLILTQHSGGGSGTEILEKVKFFEKNFIRFCKNQTLKGIINLSKGY